MQQPSARYNVKKGCSFLIFLSIIKTKIFATSFTIKLLAIFTLFSVYDMLCLATSKNAASVIYINKSHIPPV